MISSFSLSLNLFFGGDKGPFLLSVKESFQRLKVLISISKSLQASLSLQPFLEEVLINSRQTSLSSGLNLRPL